MKKSTLWTLCILNIALSGAAAYLAMTPRQAAKTVVVPPIDTRPDSTAIASPEELWAQFLTAPSYPAANQALARLPADENTGDLLTTFLRQNVPGLGANDHPARIERVAAAIQHWGNFLDYHDENSDWLESVVRSSDAPLVIRDISLRVVFEAAMRRQKQEAEFSGDAGWRTHLKELLSDGTLGNGTSIQGLCLQAIDVCRQHGLADWDQTFLTNKLQSVLAPGADAEERTVLTALSLVSPWSSAEALHEAVRMHAYRGRSEAIRIMALETLGKIGNPDDAQALANYRPESVPVAQSLWSARQQIALRMDQAPGDPASR